MGDLKEENESLKSSVHRLSVELSSYQAKYRPINPEQTVSNIEFSQYLLIFMEIHKFCMVRLCIVS